MKMYCDTCDKEMKAPGALISTPPDENNAVQELNMCVICFALGRGMKLFPRLEMN